MTKKRRKYPKEFKEEVVQYLKSSGKTVTEVAKDFNLKHYLVSRWNQEFDKENAFPGNGNPRDKEIFEMKKRIRDLEEERDILKKAMAIFSQQQ
jgi:transposase